MNRVFPLNFAASGTAAAPKESGQSLFQIEQKGADRLLVLEIAAAEEFPKREPEASRKMVLNADSSSEMAFLPVQIA